VITKPVLWHPHQVGGIRAPSADGMVRSRTMNQGVDEMVRRRNHEPGSRWNGEEQKT